jgi:hypothetical protein
MLVTQRQQNFSFAQNREGPELQKGLFVEEYRRDWGWRGRAAILPYIYFYYF